MKMKLENVISYARAVKALFDLHKDALVVYNTGLDDPFEADVLDIQIAAANAMLGTDVLKKLNKGDTKKRNDFMDKEKPILKDLEYKLGLCITDGTITDSLASFGLTAFRKGISDHNIDLFHNSYVSTYARVNIASNKAALNDVGFLAGNITAIKTNHDGAWDLNTTKINLKLEINTLSAANLALIMVLLGTCQKILDAIRAYAESISDKVLAKQATAGAVLKTVVPTEAKKPRRRGIKAGSSIILNTDLVAKNVMHLTLLTDVEVDVCMVGLKTDECMMGTPLVFKKFTELQKKDLLGSGRFVKLTNKSGTKKAFVLYYELVVTKK